MTQAESLWTPVRGERSRTARSGGLSFTVTAARRKPAEKMRNKRLIPESGTQAVSKRSEGARHTARTTAAGYEIRFSPLKWRRRVHHAATERDRSSYPSY
ncbi:unnamed protein product [Pleuronectes platessa]|uniref:Uncharacterized protein n=1 Tax=Pleuronectes platessa TaxID=8262 RepID=A0A9N7YT21_PLEPL|nr:unnamed protein product [Pleuronectes platessa]